MAAPAIDLDDLLHPDEQRRFRALCLDTSTEELAELAEQLPIQLENIREMGTQVTDVETAERLAAALIGLIGDGTGFAEDERALLRGAVEYFVLLEDADDDLADPLGFDDDVRIYNSVCARIGRSDQAIEFG